MIDSKEFHSEINQLLKKSKISSKIIVSASEDRYNAYFLINPAGQLILCTKENDLIKNTPVADVLSTPIDKLLETWVASTSIDNYHSHVNHYSKIISDL